MSQMDPQLKWPGSRLADTGQSRPVERAPQEPSPPEHETVRFVEVPVVREEVVHVPRKEVHEIETYVPVFDYQYTDKIVEVPTIEMVNTEVEVEQVQEVIRRVPVKQRLEVPKEVTRYVTKVVTKLVEKEVEVDGEVVRVPKPYLVENKVIVPRYINRDIPTVVSQIVRPEISESAKRNGTVTLKEYEPYLVPVDVYIPRPVSRDLTPVAYEDEHITIDVPPAHFNALVKAANQGATDQDVDGLLVKHLDGSVPMLNLPDYTIVPPRNDSWTKTHSRGAIHLALPAEYGPRFSGAGTTVPQMPLEGGSNLPLRVTSGPYLLPSGLLPQQNTNPPPSGTTCSDASVLKGAAPPRALKDASVPTSLPASDK